MMDDAERKESRELERLKMAVDSVKHITTLASGTIVLLATFVDKLPKPPLFKGHLVSGIVAMVVCLGASFVYLWAETLGRMRSFQLKIPFPFITRKLMLDILSTIVYFSFCMGIYFLAQFALHNI